MKSKMLFTFLAFISFSANAQTQVPNGDFERWTLHEEGISGGGDYWIPDSGWHENRLNIATRFYNSAGYFHRYEEGDADGYALKLKGSGPSANGFIRFRCDEVPASLKGRYKFSNTGCDDFTIFAYAVNSADTLTHWQLFEGTVHSSAKSFVASITETFQDFEINLSNFKAIDIDYFVIMFSACTNGSCIKTLPIGDVITNDPNGYAVIDDLELVYDIPTSVNDELWNGDIKVYPNPTKGLLNLMVNTAGINSNIQVCDITGNILIDTNIQGDATQLNLNSLTPGIYFLYIRQNMKEKTIKIIKQ
jgi:hypothetical protein